MLTEGAKMPELDVVDDEGRKFNTRELLGKPLVLWFYPKDDTPGWTNEGSQFRDAIDRFKAKDAQIVGVSKDSVASHQKFKAKYSLPFPLIADTDSKMYEAFGVDARTTFLIDKDGTIHKVWPKVSVAGHAEDVYNSLPST